MLGNNLLFQSELSELSERSPHLPAPLPDRYLMPRLPFWQKAARSPDKASAIPAATVQSARPLDLATLEDRVLFSAGPIPLDGTSGEPIETAAINAAPVLSDIDVSLDEILEDSGAPVGAVGTLISDIVDLTSSSASVDREDFVPFYAAANGDNAQRNIGLWWDGWDEWATKAKLSLEKHGSLWMHLPYGRITPGQMDFDGRSDAAAGVPPHHGPLPHISDGLAHYLEQVVTPTDELFFYFGAPYQIYTDGMTYTEFETAVLTEFSDILTLADDAKVSIGFDNTFGRPASLGGIWSVLGGPTGYHAQLFQTVASYGVNVILEPWIYKGASWAYDYDTVSAERFYRLQELHLGDEPKGTNWENRALLNNDHYRLPEDADVVEYYGGSWDTALREILSMGEIPMSRLATDDSPFQPSWIEFADELIDPSTLIPLAGYDPPDSTSLQQNSIDGQLDSIELFTGDPTFAALATNSTTGESDFTPAANLDNVFDSDGVISGVAITGVNSTNGTWWYSTSGGDNWDALGTVSDTSARLLAANPLTRIYFQPNAEYSGTIADAITFQAWDRSDAIANGTAGVDVTASGGSSAFSTASDVASLTVANTNDPPSIGSILNQIGIEDSVVGPITLTLSDIDTPLGDLIVTASSNDQTLVPDGNLSVSGSGASRSLTITPGQNQFGTATISVTVDDGTDSTTENFTVTFTPDPDPPVAVDDSYVATEDEPLVVSADGPLANDIDPDGDSLTMAIVSGPTNGSLVPQSDGSFVYTPNPGFLGSDQFQYTSTDGTFVSNVAVVQIVVQPNLAPPPPPIDPSLGRPPQLIDRPPRESTATTTSIGSGSEELGQIELQLVSPNLPANRGVRELLLQPQESVETVGQASVADTTAESQQGATTENVETKTAVTETALAESEVTDSVNIDQSAVEDSTEEKVPEQTGKDTTPNETLDNLEPVAIEVEPGADKLVTKLEASDLQHDAKDLQEGLDADGAKVAGAALATGCGILAMRSGFLNGIWQWTCSTWQRKDLPPTTSNAQATSGVPGLGSKSDSRADDVEESGP